MRVLGWVPEWGSQLFSDTVNAPKRIVAFLRDGMVPQSLVVMDVFTTLNAVSDMAPSTGRV